MWPRNISPAYDLLRGGPQGDRSLQKDDDDSESQSQIVLEKNDVGRSKMRRLGETIFAVTACFCFWVTFVTAWRTTLHPIDAGHHPSSPRQQTLTCGNSTEQATKLGCVFDLLSHNWVPAPCIDPEITAEFREYVLQKDRYWGAWPYFTDSTGTERIEDELTLSHVGDRLVVSTLEEHLAHCDFLIRRIHRAAAGLAKIDTYIAGYSHTLHCIHQLRNPTSRPLDRLSEGFWVGFSECTIEIPA